MAISMEQYKKQLNNLKSLPLAEKNIRVAGIVSDYYSKLLKSKNVRAKDELIIVGGLSMEYYTAGSYATADIDVVVAANDVLNEVLLNLGFEKEGRHWFSDELHVAIENPSSILAGDHSLIREIETPDLYKVAMISPEDIFSDRVRAVVNWHEKSQLEWLQQLWLRENLDTDYIRNVALETDQEKKFFDDFISFLNGVNKQIITEEISTPKTRFINRIDGDVEETKLPDNDYIEVLESYIVPPSEYSVNKGKYASLFGILNNENVEFRISSDHYYSNELDGLFNLKDKI
jgi:hypothetical protein